MKGRDRPLPWRFWEIEYKPDLLTFVYTWRDWSPNTLFFCAFVIYKCKFRRGENTYSHNHSSLRTKHVLYLYGLMSWVHSCLSGKALTT